MNVPLSRSVACFVIFSCALLLSPLSPNCSERAEWPCFHGSGRTNKSAETGLLTAWPDGGPRLLWKVTGLGDGYSTVSVSGGLVFVAGKKDGRTCVFAHDLDGDRVWERTNGRAWATIMSHARSYTGARSTPTVDDGVVYHLGETGRLAAFARETGDELWAVDLTGRFDAPVPGYGYAESVLVRGGRIYCNPAGEKAFIACLDKTTGDTVWTNDDIPGEAGYSSLVPADYSGGVQLIGMSSNCVYGVDAETGKTLWTEPCEGQRSLNNTDPIHRDGHVFVASGYGRGSMLLRLDDADGRISTAKVWESELMDNHHGGVILHDGFLFGAGHNERGWFCLDFMTGGERWKERGKGSLTFADGMLYLLEERGTMKLVRAAAESYDEAGAFDVPSGGDGMYWAHPVVCGGRLYVRHDDALYAYDIAGK